jgi:adenylate cyclase class IV
MPIEIERSYAVKDEKALRGLIARNCKPAGTRLFRQVNYHPGSADVKSIRVRAEGHRIAFTVKRKTSGEYLDEDEKELSSFEDALAVCDLLGLKRMYYLEKLREIYFVGRCTVTLDAYPGLPPMRLEVEAPSDDEMLQTVDLLGLSAEAKGASAAGLYQAVYGIPTERERGDLTFANAAETLGPLVRVNREGFDQCLGEQRAALGRIAGETSRP